MIAMNNAGGGDCPQRPNRSQANKTTEEPVKDMVPRDDVKDSSTLSGHEIGDLNSIHEGRNSSNSPSRNFMSRHTTSEWLTFLVGAGSLVVGVGSLVVSYMTYLNAADTSDIKAAIGNLSDLATQTKRQADAMHNQLEAVRDQVSALRDQAQEAKRQTAAIASQTEAIKASSEAAVKSAEADISAAEAQRKMAEVTAQAQKPDVALAELKISGLNGEPDENGYVHPTLMWHFRNTGGSAFTVQDVIFGVWFGDSLPPKMPEGIRGDGAGLVLTHSTTSTFSLIDPHRLDVPKDARDALIRGDTKLFFFAKFKYRDMQQTEHSRCFGREFKLKDGSSTVAVPAGGETYQCVN